MITVFVWVIGIVLVVVWLGVVCIGPPYVPTLQRDLAYLFDTLRLDARHHLVDLGAGDGRILWAAAQRNVQVSGVEINPFLVLVARWRFRRTTPAVQWGDMWQYHLPRTTTHIFVFAAKPYMKKLERYIQTERTHTGELRVVCYGFGFENRTPTRVVGAFNIYTF